MINNRNGVLAVALLLHGSLVSAQQAATCSSDGPGSLFGVSGYQCASCSVTHDKNARIEYGFLAEPVVLQIVDKGSKLKLGDVIEAVNGAPITTRAGAEQFAYPRAGTSTITVRRDGGRVQLSVAVPASCERSPAASLEPGYYIHLRDSAYRVEPPATVVRPLTPTSEPLFVIDGVIQPPAPVAAEPSRFGLAVSCLPSCTRARASDGSEYWKYDAYPTIAALRDGGPAAGAGLRVGDVIVEIDGASILEERGSLALLRSSKSATLRVAVLREGKRVEFLLRSP